MEKLVTCSKIFYDREIIDKIKYLNQKIEALKRTQVFLEKPKIEYSSFEEWKTTKEKAYQIIKNGLDQWIEDDNFEYCYMIEWGLTPRQCLNITYYIEEALNLITKENSKKWSENVANTITCGIEGFICKNLFKDEDSFHRTDSLSQRKEKRKGRSKSPYGR